MKRFFGTLKTEFVHRRNYPDRETAQRDLFAYLEAYYDRVRIHSVISNITPQQAGAKYAQPGVHSCGGGHLAEPWLEGVQADATGSRSATYGAGIAFLASPPRLW
jgi:hypothetical protein